MTFGPKRDVIAWVVVVMSVLSVVLLLGFLFRNC